MLKENMQTRYSTVAIVLHWLIALAIFGTFVLGLTMRELELSPLKLRLYSYHKWIGVSIFLLVLLRLGWRLAHRPPPPPPGMPVWQLRAAQFTHVLLYVLTLAVPLSGWLMSSASGFQVIYLGLLPIPDLLPKNKELAAQLALAHQVLNFTMAFLVIMHVAAALKHHFFDRDNVLTRMLPLIRTKENSA
jgi:cytochrome b561